jgi:hypothetical protein
VPQTVLCGEQESLFAEFGRLGLRRRIQLAGRVDLRFSDLGRWSLLVELKLDSPLGDDQRKRYLATEEPLVAVVRNAGPVNEWRRPTGNWLGAVSWFELKPALEALPLRGRAKLTWQEFLKVMEDAGDFAAQKPRSQEPQRDAELLKELRPAMVEALSSAISRRYPQEGSFVSSLSPGEVEKGNYEQNYGIEAPRFKIRDREGERSYSNLPSRQQHFTTRHNTLGSAQEKRT